MVVNKHSHIPPHCSYNAGPQMWTTHVERWLHDEDVQRDDYEQLALEGGLELEVVDLEPDQTAAAQQVATSRRNFIFRLI